MYTFLSWMKQIWPFGNIVALSWVESRNSVSPRIRRMVWSKFECKCGYNIADLPWCLSWDMISWTLIGSDDLYDSKTASLYKLLVLRIDRFAMLVFPEPAGLNNSLRVLRLWLRVTRAEFGVAPVERPNAAFRFGVNILLQTILFAHCNFYISIVYTKKIWVIFDFLLIFIILIFKDEVFCVSKYGLRTSIK